MKRIHFFYLAFISAWALLSSCKSTPAKEAIVNKWRISTLTGSTPESQKRKIINSTTIEFTKDGTYILSGTDEDQVGTYRFSDDNRWLIITTKNDYTDSSKIEELSRTKLKVINRDGDVVMTMVPQ